MVPSVFVELDSLPLSPSGKIDRKSLPAPGGERPELAAGYVAPRTQTEEVLTGIWEQVLGVDRVGIYDNFFELGGHSLLATQVVSRIRDVVGDIVSLSSVFELKTVAGLASVIDDAMRDRGRPVNVPDLVPASRDGELPLSFAQQRLWFLDQFEPDSAEYVSATALGLRGELDTDALNRALTALVARHESLRTTFESVDGRGVQVVHLPYEVLAPLVDLSELPEPDRGAELARILQQEATRPFDLSRGPLLRVRLVRLAEDEHVLTLMLHHIVTDGWSFGVIMGDLGELYRAALRAEPAELPPLPVQYADFASWQRGRLSGEALADQVGYWRRQLDGVAPLELPTDRPRPPVQTKNGAVHEFEVPAEVTAALKDLGRRQGGTLFMGLVAACKLLFARWSGQDDIAIGTVVSGRERAELEPLVGLFVNTLVLRSRVDRARTFGEFLAEVRETVLDAFAHQDVPFERVVDALQPNRDTSRNPLFDVMVVLQNTPNQNPDLPGLEVEGLALPVVTAIFDIFLDFQVDGDVLVGMLEYNTDLFDAATIERMVRHLQVLLAAIAADPTLPLGRIDILTEEERHQVLEAWNDTEAAYPQTCIHRLFEDQVARHPLAPAVIFGSEELSYRELNQRANKLAHHLRALGVVPETLVGICMERSFDLVVGLLGILKAGGAYVPLDPTYPPERLAFMIDDAGVLVLLTQQHLLETLPPHEAKVVCLDSDWPGIASAEEVNPTTTVMPDNPAYVIYTSGSTGRPKGVAIPHSAISNHLFWMQDALPLTPDDRVLQRTPFSFDASVWEFHAPLIAGARLVLLPRDAHAHKSDLAKEVAGHRVTILQLVPSLARILLEEPGLEGCDSLRRVLCGGEEGPQRPCTAAAAAGAVPAFTWLRLCRLFPPDICVLLLPALHLQPSCHPVGVEPLGTSVVAARKRAGPRPARRILWQYYRICVPRPSRPSVVRSPVAKVPTK